jgi:hypothetical protein
MQPIHQVQRQLLKETLAITNYTNKYIWDCVVTTYNGNWSCWNLCERMHPPIQYSARTIFHLNQWHYHFYGASWTLMEAMGW